MVVCRGGDGYGGLGLSLRVTPRKSGGLSKTWAQAISANGTKTSLGLGSYPVVTLAMARDRTLTNARAGDAAMDSRLVSDLGWAPERNRRFPKRLTRESRLETRRRKTS